MIQFMMLFTKSLLSLFASIHLESFNAAFKTYDIVVFPQQQNL